MVALAACGNGSGPTGAPSRSEEAPAVDSIRDSTYRRGKDECEALRAKGWDVERAVGYEKRATRPDLAEVAASGCTAAYGP